MKRILLLLVVAAIAVVDISAQHEVRITTKDGTTEIPLDEISSIQVCRIEEPSDDEFWSGWAPIEGHETGTYYMSLYTSLEFPDTVFYREHMLDETKAQFMFRFTLIGAKEDLIVDYNKETNECQVGIHDFIDNANYGPVFISDFPHNPFDLNGDGLRETYEDNPCTFDPETGTFTLNLVYFVYTGLGSSTNGYFGYGEETMQLDGFKQYDYSFSMVFDGKHTEQGENKEYAVFNIVKGADISKYLFHVVEEGNDLDATIAGMADGTISCTELTESTVLHYPIEKSGKYVALAITYDAEGNVHSEYSTNFELYLTDENPWVSLGMATYTDDIILPLLSDSVMTYQVEVLENQDTPGLFRMVDPYGPNFPLYPYASSYEEGSYIEIDATDPEGVWIEGIQSTGLDIQNYGLMSITSMAWYQANSAGATKAEVKDAGLCGIYADGVITFPVDGIVTMLEGKAYYSNRNGAFKIDMNNMQPVDTTATKAPAMRFEGCRKLSIGNNAKRVLRTVEAKKSKSIPAGIKSIEGFDPTIIEE